MTDSGEGRKEAIAMKTDALIAKHETRIEFWNARTMNEAGKLRQITIEMRNYRLHILGINKSRKKQYVTQKERMDSTKKA